MNTLKAMPLAAILCTALMGQATAQDLVRPAKVITVEASESVVRRVYPGLVLPSEEVELSFRVGGRVIELPMRAALTVEVGDVLAKLDPRDFERQITQLESQIDQSSAQLRALKAGARAEEIVALEASVAAAQAQVDQAREQAERTRELAERGVVADAKLEQDEAALSVAEANLKAQQEQLVIGQSGGRAEDIEAAEAALRGLQAQLDVARDNLSDATLRAPFSGIVARRDIENFSNIQAGQTVALLQALDVIHMAFDVPAPDVVDLSSRGIERIRNQVTFDDLPGKVFDAEAEEFSVQADSATQTYRGRVSLEQPTGAFILPGMVGRVISSTEGEDSAIRVPLTAVAGASDGAPFVWLVGEDNRVTRRDVMLGAAAGDAVEVSEGLTGGEVIVSAGVGQLVEGMEIRPVTRIGG